MQGANPEDDYGGKMSLMLTPLHADAAAARLRVTDDEHRSDREHLGRLLSGPNAGQSRHYERHQPSQSQVDKYARKSTKPALPPPAPKY
jgi:hypothetical protein